MKVLVLFELISTLVVIVDNEFVLIFYIFCVSEYILNDEEEGVYCLCLFPDEL